MLTEANGAGANQLFFVCNSLEPLAACRPLRQLVNRLQGTFKVGLVPTTAPLEASCDRRPTASVS